MADKTTTEIITEAMAKPKSISADGESASQYPLSDVLEATAALPRKGHRVGSKIAMFKPIGNSAV